MQAMHLVSRNDLRFLIDIATKIIESNSLTLLFGMSLGVVPATRQCLRCRTVRVTVEGSHTDHVHRNTAGFNGYPLLPVCRPVTGASKA